MKNSKKNISVSAALATYNEENNIVDCISSLKQVADEIIVVDGSSTDRTADLAQTLGATVIKTTNKAMFHVNKNMAIDACRGKWVLLIDADERLSSALVGEIKKKVGENPVENGFWLDRKNWFLGGFLKKGGAYPDRVIRLFKNGKGVLPEKSVHEQVKITGKIGYLESNIIHLADPNFERYLIRAIRYTDRTADDLKVQSPGKGLAQIINYMIFKPTFTFLNIYLRHKGYQDGFRGFIWALFSAAHHFYAYGKYWSFNENQKDAIN